jgi:hypothetical protein
MNACAEQDMSKNSDSILNLEMYVCHTSERTGWQSNAASGEENYSKFVYGVINGRRTECMSEAEFIRRFRSPAVIPRPPTTTFSTINTSTIKNKNYSKSDFRESDLFGMDFQFADCQQSDFSGADMRNVKLMGANCSGADFEGAYLKNANLNNADLSYANLKNAYFVSADLRGATGLTLENIRLAATIHNCKLDPEIRELIGKYCPSKFRDFSSNWGLPDDTNVRVRRANK